MNASLMLHVVYKINDDKIYKPLGINEFGVSGRVTVMDVCAIVLDGNADICVRPNISSN